MQLVQTLFEKIQSLPKERVAEVEAFVDFLSDRARRQAAMARLLEIVPALEAAGAQQMTEDAIEAEIAAVRVARRSQVSGADRS